MALRRSARGGAAFAALALWALGCPAPPERADPARAEQARAEAQAALARGDLPTARRALRELARHERDTPEALLERTGLLLQAGEAPRAVWLLEAALPRFPAHDGLRTQLARAALIVGNPVLARETLATVGPDSPEHLAARLLTAQAELELGDLEAALDTLEAAARAHPDRPEAVVARVATLLREGRAEQAVAVLERARAAAPDPTTARSLAVLAAHVALARGDLDAAIGVLDALAEREPRDGLALQRLVRALLRAGRHDEALARVEAARAEQPGEPALLAIRAQVELARGEIEAAEAAIRAFADRSDSPGALALLARFHARRGDEARTAEVLAGAVERFPDDAMLRMHHAESLVGRGELEAARRQLAAFRALAGEDDPHAAYLEARLALAEGDARAAVRSLTRLVSRLDRAYTQYWLGRALEARGDAAGAERRYGLALLRDPTHTASARARVRLAEARGDWAAVAAAALAQIEGDPSAPGSYVTAVTGLVRSGALERADELSRRARARFPARADVAAARALALRARQRLDEAEAVLDRAEREAGPAPELSEERAFVRAARGDLAGGALALRAAVERHPDRARLHAALAALELARGNAPVGIAAVDRALALDPDDPAPLALRASYHAANGAFEAARRDCQRFLELRPADAGVRFVLGVVNERLGDTEAAMDQYRRAVELDERAFAPRNNLAVLLAAEGQLADAMALAQEAYALADSDPSVVDTLGWLYLQAGLTERAVALLERAHRADPRQPAPQLHLALAYRQAGRPDEARRLLTELKNRVEPGSLLATEADAALRTLDP